jgi:hypothetical protein
MKPYPNLGDVECHTGVTWYELVDVESRLARLLWEARQAGVTCRRWSDVSRVFAPIRNNLAELVGFARKGRWHPVLVSAGAYQVAYWTLYAAVAGLLPGRAGGASLLSSTTLADGLVLMPPRAEWGSFLYATRISRERTTRGARTTDAAIPGVL